MAYNHGKEERKWRIWKEAEEKILRDCSACRSDNRGCLRKVRPLAKEAEAI